MTSAPSIHDVEPLDRGGVVARQGFAYQDHIAAAFLLDMLNAQPPDRLLAAVWCDAEDDITLIWQATVGEHVEFVQVKRNELNQLWSVAKLCEGEGATPERGDAMGSGRSSSGAGIDRTLAPRSIVEKSLARDRCVEPCTFRIVTLRDVQSELKVLTLALNHPHRQDGHVRIEAIVTTIVTRAARDREFRSTNGNDVRFWVRNVVWDVRESGEAVAARNILALGGLIEAAGGFLAQDQRRELYSVLLTLVKDAGDADPIVAGAKKKLQRNAMRAMMTDLIQRAQHPIQVGGPQPLTRKMAAASLPQAVIDAAWDLRARYRREVLQPRFLSLDDREYLEGEVAARLNALRTQLDVGMLADTPAAFHARCVAGLETLRSDLATATRPPSYVLQGAMYDLTQRCLHRFTRPELPPIPPTASESEAA